MSLYSVIDYVWEVQQQAAVSLERRIGAAALVGAAGLLLLVAGVFVAIASYMWLETFMADHWAALCVAGEFVIAALIVLALAHKKKNPEAGQVRTDPMERLADEMGKAADRVIDSSVRKIQRNPSSAIVGALAAGFVLGLVKRGDRR